MITGQDTFTKMTRVYYQKADACIIVFDLTKHRTFRNVVRWKEDVEEKCLLPDGSPVTCILLGNKVTVKEILLGNKLTVKEILLGNKVTVKRYYREIR